ncbi:MAG TPA: preprotein translocase subunit YajC [Tissierellaceae bacterium]
MNLQQFQPIIITILFLAFFYFLVIRPQKKKEAEINEMRKNLRVGDEIITIGGIRGKIVKLKDEYITVEVGTSKTKLELARWAVGSVIKKNEGKGKKEKEEDSKREDNQNKVDNDKVVNNSDSVENVNEEMTNDDIDQNEN